VATIPLTEVDGSGFTGSRLTVTAVEADSGVTVSTGAEALTVTLGDGANDVTGTSGDDVISVGDGADTIVSYDGEDSITAGDGANSITVGDGNATITGGEGVDTITAGDGNNTITLGDGADVVTAGAGDNTITNAAGNATITSGDGESTVTNTAGNSTITLGDGGNTVNLTAGNSTVVTGDGADDINITAGNNNITAGAGNDTISLGSGNDTVDAGAGTDAVDFEVSGGTWTGSIADAETITATFGGSATIDFDGITDYDTLVLTANDSANRATVRNIGSSTISLSDDNVEGGGDGNIVDLTVDTTADAAITLAIGANQEAAVAAESDFESVTLTDAASLAISTSGGSFTNVLQHDINGVTLDDDETTSFSLTSGAYTGIDTGALTSTDSLESITVAASGAESDVVVGAVADGSNLETLSVAASGLNASIDMGQIGGTDASILTSISLSASNGASVAIDGDGDTETDAEAVGDIAASENVTSFSLSADGTGSLITAGRLVADGLEVESMSVVASNGGTVDMEANSADSLINYLPGALTLETSGVGSTINADVLTEDAGALGTTEASIVIDADGAASTLSLDGSTLGGVLLDTISLHAGSNATLNMAGNGEGNAETSDVMSTITASGDVGTLTIDLDDNSTFSTAAVAAGEVGADGADDDFLTITADTFNIINIDIAATATYDAGNKIVTETSAALVDVKTLNITIADTGAETNVDLEAAAGAVFSGDIDWTIADDEGDAVQYYAGSINIAGDDGNTIVVGVQGDAADLAGQFTAGAESTFGSWTLTTGGGADAVTGGSGADTISVGAGNDTVDGGAGNDTITAGNGADSIAVGTGADSVNLTETVSAADIVVIGDDGYGSAVGTDEGTFSGFNVITGFNTTVDHIDHNDASFAVAANTFVIANTAATAAASDLAAANYKDVDSVLAFFNDAEVEDTIAADGADYAANEDILVAVTLGNGTTAIYEIYDATAATLVAGDIALVATVDTKLVFGDFM
jgi:hypothetical protein